MHDILGSEIPMGDLMKLLVGGGNVGVILPTRNKVVITQTPMNHRQIRSVLRMLREQPALNAPTADRSWDLNQPAPPKS